MAKFASYDDQAIWGVGETAELANANVEQYINAEDYAKYLETAQTAEMTPELEAIVERHGGNTSFRMLKDSRLGTWEQWENEA